MQVVKKGSVEFDTCLSCGAIWFDEGELRKVKDEVDPNLNWMDFEIWRHHDKFHAHSVEKLCPNCGMNLAAIDYADTNVVIDFCPACYGVWLDKGEFESIINALHEEIETMTVSDYWIESLEEARDIFKGDEGFVSDWKDFLTVMRLMEYRILSDRPKIAKLIDDFQRTQPFR